MTTLQNAAIRYRNAIIVPRTTSSPAVKPELAAAFLQNLTALGYIPSAELVDRVRYVGTDNEFKQWATEILETLRTIKGANFRYEPMYPNFPAQVAEASELELFINAAAHYWGDWFGMRVMPNYVKEARFPLYEKTVGTLLSATDNSIAKDLLVNLMRSKVSFSSTDIELFEILFTSVTTADFIAALPGVIPNKENLATVAKAVRGVPVLAGAIFNRASTATDLLRIAAVYSNASPSLTQPFRFGKFSRAERRAFLHALVTLGDVSEDFKRNDTLWKRFAEKLHPAEYLSKDSALLLAFAQLRSGKNISTWGTHVEEAFANGDVKDAVSRLVLRPGEFARRLNQLLENSSYDETEYVLNEFEKVAEKVSTPVLWQVVSFFRTLQNNPERKYSTIFTKGISGSAFALKRTPTHITQGIISRAIDIALEAVTKAYAGKESLGKVFFDTDGYNPAIPFGLRTYNSSFKVAGRGTRTQFDTEKTLRFFIHWRDQQTEDAWSSRVDLDLSAVALNEKFEKVGEITYYNLRDFGGIHSGDITSAPEGASEFIDIPVQQFLKREGARYVAMTVHSYTGQKFSDLDEVLAGFMTREDAQSGEIYEPSTVENAFSVNSTSTSVIPMVFDMKTGEAIWIDVPMTGASWYNNVHNTAGLMSNILEGIVNKKFVGVNELLMMHVDLRGERVNSADEADTIITVKNDEMSIGFDEIIGKWL
jgi:hypothetical protein